MRAQSESRKRLSYVIKNKFANAKLGSVTDLFIIMINSHLSIKKCFKIFRQKQVYKKFTYLDIWILCSNSFKKKKVV